MSLVTTDPGIEGLAQMIADLIRANLERDPERGKLVTGVTGTINIKARDAGVEMGLEFACDRLHVFGEPFRRAGLEVICDSGTLMELSTVPLRFGRPDAMTPEGRAMIAKIFRGTLRVKGMFAHPVLLGRLQRLLSVA